MIQNYKNSFPQPVLLFISSLLLVLFSGLSSASERIGLVKTNKPTAAAIRQGVEIKLQSGNEIFKGDTIITDSNGAIGVTFNDGAVLSLGSNSKIIIDDYLFEPAQRNVSFVSRVILGSVAFMSGAIGRISPEAVHFITPTATLGLRGTKILIEVE